MNQITVSMGRRPFYDSSIENPNSIHGQHAESLASIEG